jgi:hypothetical protein
MMLLMTIMMAFENKPLRIVTERKAEEVIEGYRTLHKAALHNLHYLANIIVFLLFFSSIVQPFGPWPIFQFLKPIHSQYDSLD